jgi:dTDP-L-rhamnose 4-epimerase
MSTVLITGGAGFIGSTLAPLLHGSGHDVVVVDALIPQVHAGAGWPERLPAGVTRHPLDVTVASSWDALLSTVQPDVVVHLAAETGTAQSLSEASLHARTNVVGTTELLDALSRRGHVPERLVVASSRAVYGEGRWTGADGTPFYAAARDKRQLEAGSWLPVSPTGVVGERPLAHDARTTEPRPANVYAATKLAQEHLLAAWAGARGTDLTVLRLQNVYGPGQSLTNPYTGIVSMFAQLGLRGQPIDLYEDGGIVRDFVFIDDVAAALFAAVEKPAAGSVTVDIGSGGAVTLRELAEVIAEQTGSPQPQVSGRFRLGDVRAAYADVTAAGDVFGWSPAVDVRSGVAQLLRWIAETAPPG